MEPSEHQRQGETEGQARAEHIQNPEVAHEHGDVNVRAILTFVVVMTVVGAIVHLALWGMFVYLRGSAAQADPDPHPLVSGERPQPPEPRLQADPVRDMDTLRRNEEQRLNSFGWVDRDAGKVHIPIEHAMKLLVERGLPVKPEGRAAAAAPAARASEPSRGSTREPKR